MKQNAAISYNELCECIEYTKMYLDHYECSSLISDIRAAIDLTNVQKTPLLHTLLEVKSKLVPEYFSPDSRPLY